MHPATLRPEHTVLPRTRKMQRSDWRGRQAPVTHSVSPITVSEGACLRLSNSPHCGVPWCVCEREREGEEEERRREGGRGYERPWVHIRGKLVVHQIIKGCCFAAGDVPPILIPSSPQNILFLKLSHFSFDKLLLFSIP